MTTMVFDIVQIFDVHVSSCRTQLYNLQCRIVLQLSRNKIVVTLRSDFEVVTALKMSYERNHDQHCKLE